jgi:hypothetical protein
MPQVDLVKTWNKLVSYRFPCKASEEQNMRLTIMVGFTALALGAALASVPAVAYTAIPGYSSQGGVVAIPHSRHPNRYGGSRRQLYNRTIPKGGYSAGQSPL